MRNLRYVAVPGLILAGALALTGCGDKDTPAAPSTSPSAMMSEDDMMSPSPSAMMSDEDDDMMSPSPSAMMSDDSDG